MSENEKEKMVKTRKIEVSIEVKDCPHCGAQMIALDTAESIFLIPVKRWWCACGYREEIEEDSSDRAALISVATLWNDANEEGTVVFDSGGKIRGWYNPFTGITHSMKDEQARKAKEQKETPVKFSDEIIDRKKEAEEMAREKK